MPPTTPIPLAELFGHLIHWVGANPGWAYLVVFAAAFAESLAVIGLLVPGVMILLAAGALIAAGELHFLHTCLAAASGAIGGDGLSYWLGRHYGERIRCIWPFSRYPQQLDLGMAFFERHGGKSIAFGRFFGPVRAVIPLVAGVLQMAPGRFVAANVGSAVAWAPAYLAPGIVFGASLKLAAEAATRLAILLLLLLGLIWLSLWGARRLYRWLSPHASSGVRALLRWADVHPKIGRIAQALADPDHPDAATLTGLAAALLVAAALVGASVGAGLVGSAELTLNHIALDLGRSLHTPLSDRLLLLLDRLGSPAVLGTVAAGVLLYLHARGRRRDAGYWLAACGFALLAIPVLGWLLRVPRPDAAPALGWSWSFPSATVLGATLVYGFLAIMVSRGIRGGGRWLPYAAASAMVLSVALARLYFGLEWLSDVIGSAALGLVWISALGLAFHRHSRGARRWQGLTIVAGLSLVAGVSAASIGPATPALERYRPRPVVQDISVAQWRQRACAVLPRHREDLWRREDQRFDIAYAGSLADLAAALEPRGWQPAEMLRSDNLLKLLSPSLPLPELPLIPHVHEGSNEALALVKNVHARGSGVTRLVLRLWRTRCRIAPSTPVWVATLTAVRKEEIVGLIALPITIGDDQLTGRHFAADLAQNDELALEPGSPALVATRRSGLLPP